MNTRTNIKGITFLLALVMVLGLIVMYSASYIVIYRWPGVDYTYYFNRQLIHIILGMVFMFVAALIPFKRHMQWAPAYMIVAVVLLLAVFLFPSKGGSHRWIPLGNFDIQPSEFAKIILILFLSAYLAKRKDSEHRSPLEDFVIPVGWVFLISGLVLAEPDLSSSLILFMVGMLILFVSGISKKYFFFLAIGMACAFFLLVQSDLLKGYQLQRLQDFAGFLRGEAQEQVDIGMRAISSGGLLGEGLAMGDYKYLLPVQFTDFIFAILGEELGFVGMALMLVLYYLLARSMIRCALHAVRNLAGKLVIVGYAYLILMQVVINVGVVLGIIPPTGITLPLVSYGGSSMLAFLGGFGLVLSVITHTEDTDQKTEVS